jgi:hypothetical protein
MKECNGDIGMSKAQAILKKIIQSALVGCVATPENISENSQGKKN